MNSEKLKKEILEKIEKENIIPKPRWQFLLKEYFVWIIGAVFVVVGGLAFSAIIFVFVNCDWQYYHYLSGSFFNYFVTIAPFVWFVLLALFIAVADYDFKHTKKGYKYSLFEVAGLSIVLSLLLGCVFYFSGLGYGMEYYVSKAIPGYKNMMDIRRDLWNQPESGLLVGKVVSKNNDGFVLESFDGKIWNIDGSKLDPMHNIILDNVAEVRVVGIITEGGLFKACDIGPWFIGGQNNYLREKIKKQMLNEGIMPVPFGIEAEQLDNLRGQFRMKNFDERNILNMRINMCERGTSTPQRNRF